MDTLKKIAVPLFHGVAGLVIFLGPFFAKGAPKGFFWVGIGGLLIGLGGIALAFISVGAQLLFFSPAVCDDDPHPPALPDDRRVRAWLCKERVS